MENQIVTGALPDTQRSPLPPTQRPWKPRIPEIIKDLERSGKGFFTRSDIEQALEVRRSQADTVMRQVGIRPGSEAELSGKLNVVRYDELVVWLEIHYDAAARKEHDRLERVQKKLDEAKGEQAIKARLPKFDREHKEHVKQALLGDIEKLPGVVLERPEGGRAGRLEILYLSPVDLIAKLQLFGWTIIHQEEKFYQMTEPSGNVQPAPRVKEEAPPDFQPGDFVLPEGWGRDDLYRAPTGRADEVDCAGPAKKGGG